MDQVGDRYHRILDFLAFDRYLIFIGKENLCQRLQRSTDFMNSGCDFIYQ